MTDKYWELRTSTHLPRLVTAFKRRGACVFFYVWAEEWIITSISRRFGQCWSSFANRHAGETSYADCRSRADKITNLHQLFIRYRDVSIYWIVRGYEKCPVYSGFRFTGAQFSRQAEFCHPKIVWFIPHRPVYWSRVYRDISVIWSVTYVADETYLNSFRDQGVVSLVSKLNQTSWRYFEPINIILCNKTNNYRRDLTDVPSKQKTLPRLYRSASFFKIK